MIIDSVNKWNIIMTKSKKYKCSFNVLFASRTSSLILSARCKSVIFVPAKGTRSSKEKGEIHPGTRRGNIHSNFVYSKLHISSRSRISVGSSWIAQQHANYYRLNHVSISLCNVYSVFGAFHWGKFHCPIMISRQSLIMQISDCSLS